MENLILSIPRWIVHLFDLYGLGYVVAFIAAMLDLSDWEIPLSNKIALSFQLAFFSWVYVVKILIVWIKELRYMK